MEKKITAKKFPPIILIGPVQVARVNELIEPLPKSGVIYEVIIREHKTSRSLAQNNTLHAWCNQISQQYAEDTGKFYPMEHWKIYLKSLFLGDESFEVNGQVITQPRSTAKLKLDEFRDLLEKIDHYAGSELSIILERGEDYALAIYGKRK